MEKGMELSEKKVLVVGMAESGIAATRFLLARGAKVVVSELKGEEVVAEKAMALRALGATVETGGHSRESFLSAELIVVSPGVPLGIPGLAEARRKNIPIISEIELAYRFARGRIIGITGANGKTTTTTLVGEILRKAGFRVEVVGNIGRPFINYAEREVDYFVLELSSFQLEAIDHFRADIAVLLNITPDHMDRYSSFEDYAEAKGRIFLNQREDDFAVVNLDDPVSRKIAEKVGSKLIWISRTRELSEGVFVSGDRVSYRLGDGKGEVIPLSEIALFGVHNLENVLSAVAVALIVGARPEPLREVLRSFKGLPHRLEFVAEIEGIRFFNDSKATNIEAVAKAIESFESPLILILGGRDKNGDFSALIPLIKKRVKTVLTIGEAAKKIEGILGDVVPLRRVSSLAEAVKVGFSEGKPGDTVLLSPGCASFDMFLNFEERGDVFKEEVRKLKRRRENA